MKYVLSLLFVILLVGCKEVNSKDEQKLQNFVKEWNESHTVLKTPYLAPSYMNVVSYYGKQRTRAQVIHDKQMLFEQFPDYTQSILNNEIEVTSEAGKYLITFKKHVRYNGIEADYDSYLSVTLKNGDFRILREGVAETSNDLDAPIFPKARENSHRIASNRQLFGDFNGDGLSDYATVISPKIIGSSTSTSNDAVECQNGCDSVIVFSSGDLEDIKIKGAYQSQLENLKDLNRDGADEIGFWDIKPNSKTLYVYNATNGALLTEPIFINAAVHKNIKLIDVFKKSGVNKITVTRSVEEEGKWVLKSQIINLD